MVGIPPRRGRGAGSVDEEQAVVDAGAGGELFHGIVRQGADFALEDLQSVE
jgi:hypothetical protein